MHDAGFRLPRCPPSPDSLNAITVGTTPSPGKARSPRVDPRVAGDSACRGVQHDVVVRARLVDVALVGPCVGGGMGEEQEAHAHRGPVKFKARSRARLTVRFCDEREYERVASVVAVLLFVTLGDPRMLASTRLS